MFRSTALFGLLLLTASQLMSATANADDTAVGDSDAASLLSMMSSAMQTLTYEGTFVHMQSGQTDVFLIQHASTATGELERMSSLNGEAREIYRTNAEVVWVWPNNRDVIVMRAKPRKVFKAFDAESIDSSAYTIKPRGDDRVAGVATDVLEVAPIDDFRYGYRFWIDKSTGMMLRSIVLSARNQPVEELIFTEINYLDSIDAEVFVASEGGGRMEFTETDKAETNDQGTSVDKVSFKSLPTGFTERAESLRLLSIREDDPVSHVMVSDGIASVSVYVEYVDRNDQDTASLGAISMGAMNAYGYSLPNALVTAVGEVPEKTVELIARAVTLADG